MTNSGVTVYKLKGEKTPNTFAIRHYNVMIEVEDGGLKEIGYYPGSDSIFANDNKKRQKANIVFEYNGFNATEFVADNSDIILNEYLQKHPDFGKIFEIFSKEKESQKELEKFEKMEKALEKINETDSVKIKALALAIYGLDAYGLTEVAAKAKLKETAFKEPEVILYRIEDKNYKYKFLSAHAFFAGIVKENEHKTAVMWNDETMGTILHLATGETGIFKLAEKLSVNDMEARTISQQIGERIMKQDKANDENRKQVVIVDNSAEKDAEIAKLKAQIEEMQNKADNPPLIEPASTKEEVNTTDSSEATKEEVKTNSNDNQKSPEEVLKDLQEQYKTKFNNDVPARFKNDAEWITGKLNE